jgi:hypothetical protein
MCNNLIYTSVLFDFTYQPTDVNSLLMEISLTPQLHVGLYSYTVELGYNVTIGTEYFMSLQKTVVITEEYNVVISSDELIGTTKYLTV